jgi:flagellar assembly protein FliH
MVALCWETVCRMLGEQAATSDGVRMHVLETLRTWRARGALSVHLNPGDLQQIADGTAGRAAIDSELERAGHTGVQWIADPTVALGGCIVRSEEGGLDARLETQLAALKVALLAARARKTEVREGGA